jgi:hypothetical protein
MIVFLISRVLLCALLPCLVPGRAVRAGQTPGPSAKGYTLDGRPIDAVGSSNASGKIAVLLFVRTDCPIANRYAPLIRRLAARHAQTTAFWLVYPDKKESTEQIRKHQQEFGYALPAVRDPEHALVRLAGAEITPEAAVFDRKGTLVYHGRIDNLYEDVGKKRPTATTHELEDAIAAVEAGATVKVGTAAAVGCTILDMQ